MMSTCIQIQHINIIYTITLYRNLRCNCKAIGTYIAITAMQMAGNAFSVSQLKKMRKHSKLNSLLGILSSEHEYKTDISWAKLQTTHTHIHIYIHTIILKLTCLYRPKGLVCQGSLIIYWPRITSLTPYKLQPQLKTTWMVTLGSFNAPVLMGRSSLHSTCHDHCYVKKRILK